MAINKHSTPLQLGSEPRPENSPFPSPPPPEKVMAGGVAKNGKQQKPKGERREYKKGNK